MRMTLPAIALIALTSVASSAGAQEIAPAELEIMRCGIAYYVFSQDEKTEEADRAVFSQNATLLLDHVEARLADRGMAEADRSALGESQTFDIIAALDRNDRTAFDPQACEGVLARLNGGAGTGGAADAATGSPPVAAAQEAELPEVDAETDMLLTCGSGFLITGHIKREEGDETTATQLEELGLAQVTAGIAMMMENGLDEATRDAVGQRYVEEVAAMIYGDGDIGYDWNDCAGLR